MREVAMKMPKMGESVMEATIIKWLKKEGDTVLEGESIVEVATDKVDSEIPAPYTGKLKKILAKVGQIIMVENPIAIIETAEIISHVKNPVLPIESSASPILASKAPESYTLPREANYWPIQDKNGRFYSPLVRYIAQKEELSSKEMEHMPGTGKNNRVTKQDILFYLKNNKKYKPIQNQTIDTIQKYLQPGDEVIAMDRVRKLIAHRMVTAVQTIPHVTSFVEADLTDLVAWREQRKIEFKQKTGVGLTYMSLFIEAVAQTIYKYPLINVSVVGDYIIKRKDINIGIAVALSDGNLIVPVIKKADQLSLTEIALRIHTLVENARNSQLLPDDIADGTYTISNIGTFDNLMGTPIIMQPQVAILAMGSIIKKPSVLETKEGDQFCIRHKMYLSHTYDHRVVDGALGGTFVKSVADYLEKFDISKTIDKL